MRAIMLIAALLSVLPLAASAQEDRRAGLFTSARQLPLVSQSIQARIVSGEAEVEIVQVFANDGEEIAQADYHLYLPQGATVAGFGFWQDGTFLAAKLKEREEARAAHHAAAAEGRATALMKQEANIHTFSVYPLRKGELKQIETRLRVPVVMEMGTSRLRLPIDSFMGQAPVDSPVLVEITSDEPLAGAGVAGAKRVSIGTSIKWAMLAFSSRRPVEVWYHEEVPPLLARAEAVPLDDGKLGLQIRVILYDAGAWRAPYEELHLLVDASFSMRRRARALYELIGRVADQAPVEMQVHGVAAEGHLRLPEALGVDSIVQQITSGRVYGSTAEGFFNAAKAVGCAKPEVRCAVITDPQLPQISSLTGLDLPVVILSDPHEQAHFADALPVGASVFLPDVDPAGRLASIGDELVLPVLGVRALLQQNERLDLIGEQSMRVAEGGMLRLFALTDTLEPILLGGEVGGRALEREIPITLAGENAPSGQTVRRGVYRELLASWMKQYRLAPDPALKQRIVEVSLREEIPTRLTSLQVDDPKLSLYATKPGDPLLTVYLQPGLEEVVAWYPFGETRRLIFDEESRTFTDRFLVPRGWSERLYRIEIFKIYAEGWIERAHAWYQIDEKGPSAQVFYDPAERILRIDTGDETRDVSSVMIHAGEEGVMTLSPVDGQWMMLADELPERFTIYVRDRAGNRSAFACVLKEGLLSVDVPSRTIAAAPELPSATMAMTANGDGLAIRGRDLVMSIESGVIRFAAAGLDLRSLDVTATHDLGAGRTLFATAGGDLVRVECHSTGARCAGKRLASFPGHPITGIEPLSRRTQLVGVLGNGLYELRGDTLRRSRIKVGSRFITGVVKHSRDVFVGTAYNGLWRTRGRRAVKTRFVHPHVAALESTPSGLVIESGFGRYLRRSRNRFEFAGLGTGSVPSGSPDLTAAVVFEGSTFVAGFDSGLFRLEGNRLDPVELGLDTAQKRINAMLVWQNALWLGTEAGLLKIDRDVCGVGMDHVLQGAVHDLATSPHGLAVASSTGVHLVGLDGRPRRVDSQEIGTGRYFSVAWWGGRLYAGGMEGLYWFDEAQAGQVTVAQGFDANWVTALLPDSDRLLVGTYDRGVWAVADGRAAPLPALCGQWVPPHSMRRINDAVWIGGLGMPPARLDDRGNAIAVPIPARDVNDFLPLPAGTLLLTSHGVARLAGDRSLAAAE